MKKILITYATYGNGHKTIAEYIYNYLKDTTNYNIELIDILDYTNRKTAFTVKTFNFIFHHRMSGLWSTLYKSMDNKLSIKGYEGFVKKIVFNKGIQKKYIDYNPDLVFSTHFYGSNIASLLKKKNKLNAKIMTIVTDYKVHRFWMSSEDKNEYFIVANEFVKNDMIKKKCYSKNIYPFGLPFNESKIEGLIPKEAIYKKYNIPMNKKTILFFGGGSIGSITYLKYLKTIAKLNLNYQIAFVCGNSTELYEKANKYAKNHSNIHVFGFVKNPYELMDISDLVISKAGAATITECLEMQKIMLLLPGIGGQEKYNTKFVVKNNYGTYARFRSGLKKYLLSFEKNYPLYIEKYNNKKIDNQSLAKIKELIDKVI